MSDDLNIRPARPEDRPAMERICAHTWDDDDYIPQVWDEWLADENGPLLVAEMGGQVVSLNKVTLQPGGQVWLEGMRVDPDYRGRGVAHRCLEWNLDFARERGARVIRLATGGDNTVVHHMTARAGLAHIGTYVLRTADPLPGGMRPVVLGPEMAAQVAGFFMGGPVLAATHGLYSTNWAWEELSAERLAEMLNSGQVVALLDGSGSPAAMATIHYRPGYDGMWVGLAEGQPQAVTELATTIRAEAAAAGAPRAWTMLPELPWLREAFLAAGYDDRYWDGELWIMELVLAAPGSPNSGPAAQGSGVRSKRKRGG